MDSLLSSLDQLKGITCFSKFWRVVPWKTQAFQALGKSKKLHDESQVDGHFLVVFGLFSLVSDAQATHGDFALQLADPIDNVPIDGHDVEQLHCRRHGYEQECRFVVDLVLVAVSVRVAHVELKAVARAAVLARSHLVVFENVFAVAAGIKVGRAQHRVAKDQQYKGRDVQGPAHEGVRNEAAEVSHNGENPAHRVELKKQRETRCRKGRVYVAPAVK